jgi:hypothetical protein
VPCIQRQTLMAFTTLAMQLEPLVYTKPDDEYFHKHCSWSFTIATPNALLHRTPHL